MHNPLLSKSLLALLIAAPLFSACSNDDDDPTPDEDNEQITTLTYTLTPQGGGTPVSITYRDLDGDGGAAATISPATLVLAPGTTYTGAVTLLDETKTPAENITAEVQQEADEHLLVFTPSGVNLTITRTDRDSKNLEIGLATRAVAGAANTAGTTGSLKIALRHQPGTKDGSATPGDTDVEVTFPTAVR
ncbi:MULTISPECIES: hypothetical protein [Hymenobacter]|uniref:Type 1 periplasmic binding fold superfamily protein n=1 Tax=Hymenobacter yonginensis TaxID=748197 RepID=A0ABY7PMM5_9BACT|nr:MULTISPECIES: hypothetical protein [Hymenobacter]AII51678.1 hypothetical protein N008_06730 [Hymenobacter sp. APR13]WBO84409.1 hypothetical protein O9Z63_18825 [Hymenobacter yonginensis]